MKELKASLGAVQGGLLMRLGAIERTRVAAGGSI